MMLIPTIHFFLLKQKGIPPQRSTILSSIQRKRFKISEVVLVPVIDIATKFPSISLGSLFHNLADNNNTNRNDHKRLTLH